jgi:hypothetical protein
MSSRGTGGPHTGAADWTLAGIEGALDPDMLVRLASNDEVPKKPALKLKPRPSSAPLDAETLTSAQQKIRCQIPPRLGATPTRTNRGKADNHFSQLDP